MPDYNRYRTGDRHRQVVAGAKAAEARDVKNRRGADAMGAVQGMVGRGLNAGRFNERQKPNKVVFQQENLTPPQEPGPLPAGMTSGGPHDTVSAGVRQGNQVTPQSPNQMQPNPTFAGGAQGMQNPMQDQAMAAYEKRIAELEAMVASLHSKMSMGGGMQRPMGGGGQPYDYQQQVHNRGFNVHRGAGPDPRGKNTGGRGSARAARAKSEGRAMDRMSPSVPNPPPGQLYS